MSSQRGLPQHPAQPRGRLLPHGQAHCGGLHQPQGPAFEGLSPSWQGSAWTPNRHSQTLAPSPVPQALRVPQRGVHFRPWPWGSPGVSPLSSTLQVPHRQSPWAARSAGPFAPGFRGFSPWKSGRKSHSQKVPKLQRSEVRSQAAAAADTSPSNPRRSEPRGRQPRVAAAIRVRPELVLRRPTASPENYSSRRASRRRPPPAAYNSRLPSRPSARPAWSSHSRTRR